MIEKIDEPDLSKMNSSVDFTLSETQIEPEKQNITDEISPQTQKPAAEQKVQEIPGKSYYNPAVGETFNLAVSKDTKSVDYIIQDKDGIFKKHTFILDKDEDIKNLSTD